MADIELASGLKVLFGGGDAGLARVFFDRCCRVLDRIEKEDDYSSMGMFPYNRGYTRRTRAILEMVAHDKVPGIELLNDAGADIDTYIRQKSGSETIHSSYLDVAELLVLAGDSASAARMLRRARSWKTAAERVNLVKDLVAGGRERDREFVGRFEQYFDRLRAPKRELTSAPGRPTVAIWGALYDHVVLGRRPFSCARAIAAASA
jgi:hypothetical protein